MGYRNLRSCLDDLEKHGQLKRISTEVDPYLEVGLIQRLVYRNGGPALLFTNVKGTKFPMAGNIFGTMERTRFIFRDALPVIETLVKAKLNPKELLKKPSSLFRLPKGAYNLLPKTVSTGAVTENTCALSDLPQFLSWSMDGGGFITLPLVYTESLEGGYKNSNLGMYRVQISGNDYLPDECGLHYQIHRGIGIHHTQAEQSGEKLRVNVFIGGAPSLTLAAVMPLPEGMPEVSFAGVLGGHRIPFVKHSNMLPMPAESDFVISGTIDPKAVKPEGPFGDHVGYYSLQHDFPVMKVDKVWHRNDAVFPFTSVGRPPQEDTSFGEFIHELTGDLIPAVLPGIKAVHAVDAAGVHPLLLAIGSERYTPYEKLTEPKEILTQANAVLGQGQLSLAKYLFIANHYDDQSLDIHRPEKFLRHMLERVDWRRDLHFQTSVTIDTLDYTGHGLNKGSKVVIAAAGDKVRKLHCDVPENVILPTGFSKPAAVMDGVLVIEGPKCYSERGKADKVIQNFCESIELDRPINEFPLIVIVDDGEFASASIDNFLWVTFTRSNPATDIYGIGSYVDCKHFGCEGALVIDARMKPFHAPALELDAAVERKVMDMAAKGGPLEGLF
ncbi:Carboxylyase-related protein [Denitrovibrio acetiphilus DSM 12809]|uniref:Carboxylyase-related protein n=1 Tax=Denitrovibrio acetiphilus (strain DSM 12809 / NBRC 114555 / N2460) TaxID=522772 RepID=D4H4Z4_DENA2|nr:UbiD family decarboxylase [Denitrovibrio acetiphilus]ADD69350.1 Carboxylyase-related protein [Denitrovibrio acetiphilus DSM 12809]